jgi:hypothetical protein
MPFLPMHSWPMLLTQIVFVAPPVLSFDLRQLVDEAIQALPWKEVPHLVDPDQSHQDVQGRLIDDVPPKKANAQSSAANLSGHLAFVRFALSQILTSGLNAPADKICSEQLGLSSIQMGSFGLQRCFVSLLLLAPRVR